jgi:hypothetical protein
VKGMRCGRVKSVGGLVSRVCSRETRSRRVSMSGQVNLSVRDMVPEVFHLRHSKERRSSTDLGL